MRAVRRVSFQLPVFSSATAGQYVGAVCLPTVCYSEPDAMAFAELIDPDCWRLVPWTSAVSRHKTDLGTEYV